MPYDNLVELGIGLVGYWGVASGFTTEGVRQLNELGTGIAAWEAGDADAPLGRDPGLVEESPLADEAPARG